MKPLRSQFYVVPLLVIASMTLHGALTTFAATSPSLGMAATYGVLANTFTDTSGATTVNGDVGFTTGPASAIAGVHTNYGSGAPYATAGTDQGSALSTLASQPCTFTFADGAINLSTDATHGTAGIYTPGVYCSNGAMSVAGPITLNGNGTYIFRAVGALTSTVGSVVTLAGSASACDVFWTPTAATTFAATTTFAGTVIANAGITVGASTTWTGRALAYGGTVTTATDTITVPTCTSSSSSSTAVGGDDSQMRRPIISVTKIPTPLALPGPGFATYDYEISNHGIYAMNTITLTDNKCDDVHYLSGDDNADALMQTNEVWKYRCTMWLTQDTYNEATATGFANGYPAKDIAYASVNVGNVLPTPLIHVLKKPNLFLLPYLGGKVTYTYTVTNPGVVALRNVRVADDKCSAMQYVSGDTDDNNLMDVDETWIYLCKANLSVTTTNTVTVTGSANNMIATDVAFATVVVSPRAASSSSSSSAQPEVHYAAPEVPVIDSYVPLLPNTGVGPDATDPASTK